MARDNHRLRFLLGGNSPHPPTIVRRDMWMAERWSAHARNSHRALLRGLTHSQQIMFKIALRYPLNEQEIVTAHEWWMQGRFRMDHIPSVFVYNLGRRAGKTELAMRVALARDVVGQRVSYIVPNQARVPPQTHMLNSRNPAWSGQVVSSNARSLAGLTDGHYIVDETFAIRPDRFVPLIERAIQHDATVVVLTTAMSLIRIPAGVPTLAVSLPTLAVRPQIGLVDSTSEYHPSGVNSVVDHEFQNVCPR